MADLRMPEVNSVTLAGNLTRDPVYKTAESGNTLIFFTVATNRKFRDRNNNWKEDVSYIPIIAKNRLADSCNQFLKKGSAVLVEGELQSRKWKNNDGKVQRLLEVKAHRIQFLNKFQVQHPSDASESRETGDASVPHDEAGEQQEANDPTTPQSFEDDDHTMFLSQEESERLHRESST